ncbi:hypothetical protein ACWD26_31435 [Streptomyces sp. NPDC002787]
MDSQTNPLDTAIQRIRAWAGILVVLLGDLTIMLAAIWGVTGVDGSEAVAILTSAFTAISTMTTAYFGIRAATNATQSPGTQAQAQAAPLGPLSPQTVAPGSPLAPPREDSSLDDAS